MEKHSELAVIDNLKVIRENIFVAAQKSGRTEDDIRLMAVTKTVAPELVNVAINNGVKLLGENRVQEYLDKKDFYLDAEVQFIGHLQTNKELTYQRKYQKDGKYNSGKSHVNLLAFSKLN